MFKMVEHSSYEANKIYPNSRPSLSDEKKFSLNKINEIKDYLVVENEWAKDLVNI